MITVSKLIQSILRELVTSERARRLPEPDLVMDDPEKVAAYVEAGRESAVMAPVYLFHGSNICEIIRPGDTVVDLACGPANQLAMVARLNPLVHFIGVDLSPPMLERARDLIDAMGLTNVEFRLGDITDLSMFENASIDAVQSTMALHHLPTPEHLAKTFSEVDRILKPGGGIYMADFGHLKANRTIDYFADQYKNRQPDLFTEDYRYSLRAAFSLNEFKRAAAPLLSRAKLRATIAVPFMVALKTPPRRGDDPALRAALAQIKKDLPEWHHADIADLKRHFSLGGMSCDILA